MKGSEERRKRRKGKKRRNVPRSQEVPRRKIIKNDISARHTHRTKFILTGLNDLSSPFLASARWLVVSHTNTTIGPDIIPVCIAISYANVAYKTLTHTHEQTILLTLLVLYDGTCLL